MLDYVKTILSKVSFDRALFKKELRKALKQLIPDEIRELKEWCYAQFGEKYPMELRECFN